MARPPEEPLPNFDRRATDPRVILPFLHGRTKTRNVNAGSDMGANGNRRTCEGTKENGDPCESPFVGTDGFCDAHRAGGLEEVRRRAHRGGEVTKAMFEASLHDLPPLDSPENAQTWLHRIGRALALGKLSGSAGRAAIGAVRAWLRAYEAGEQASRIERLQEAVEELQAAGRI